MHFLRGVAFFFLSILAVGSALTVPRSIALDRLDLPGKALTRPQDPQHELKKRNTSAFLVRERFAKTWFKIGKSRFKDYRELAEENDKDGIGFHSDFGDLVDSQLPDPPRPINSLDNLFPNGL